MTEEEKQEVIEIMKIPGNVRGAILQTLADYIRYKKKDEGVKMVEEKLKELGHPLKFEEIKPLSWYPESTTVLILFASKEVFNWADDDIFEMGNFTPKSSFIVTMFIKHFVSLKKTLEQSNIHWRKNLDFGEFEPTELNEKEKYIVLRIKGVYKFHRLLCIYHGGYFLRVAQFVIKSKKITIEETKCMLKGAPYHEYLVRWE